MKNSIKIALFFLIFINVQCSKNNDFNSDITPEQLEIKKQEILDYISSFSCSNSSNCNYIAFGAKPCGGPRMFLVYPNALDQTTLTTMVNEYYEMDNQYNIQTGAISDCSTPLPPNTIACVNGVCTIID